MPIVLQIVLERCGSELQLDATRFRDERKTKAPAWTSELLGPAAKRNPGQELPRWDRPVKSFVVLILRAFAKPHPISRKLEAQRPSQAASLYDLLRQKETEHSGKTWIQRMFTSPTVNEPKTLSHSLFHPQVAGGQYTVELGPEWNEAKVDVLVRGDAGTEEKTPPEEFGAIADEIEATLSAPDRRVSTQHPLLVLFHRCGLVDAFRIKTQDHRREDAVKQMVVEELDMDQGQPHFRLAANSGFNYLHVAGKVWNMGLGKALTDGKAKFECVLQSPCSDFAVARALANKVDYHHWEPKVDIQRLKELAGIRKKNIDIRVTRHPVNCSLFFTRKAVLYDPYLWGRPAPGLATENNFWVFKFEQLEEGAPDYECYHLLERHFDFLFSQGRPLRKFLSTFDDCEKEFRRKLSECKKGLHA